jgi:hypothetical protein
MQTATTSTKQRMPPLPPPPPPGCSPSALSLLASAAAPLLDCFSASFFFCRSRALAVVDSTAFSTLVTSLAASVGVRGVVGRGGGTAVCGEWD